MAIDQAGPHPVAGLQGQTAQPPVDQVRTTLRRILNNPVMGFAPWIIFSVVEGPGRFSQAAGAALGAALLILLLGVAIGIRAKLLDLAAIAFFAVLLVLGLAVGQAAHAWLERWSGEISNVMIVLVALGSVVARRPFTLQYAREVTEREYWDSPLFVHINYVLTWVWIAAFLASAVVGWYGDGPLHQPDNIWTNWIVSIALLIFAIRFTEWYPTRAKSAALREAGAPDDTDQRSVTLAALFVPLTAYLVPIGIVFLVFNTTPWWIGVSLIVIGGSVTQHLRQAEVTPPTTQG
jgi:MFS family permease